MLFSRVCFVFFGAFLWLKTFYRSLLCHSSLSVIDVFSCRYSCLEFQKCNHFSFRFTFFFFGFIQMKLSYLQNSVFSQKFGKLLSRLINGWKPNSDPCGITYLRSFYLPINVVYFVLISLIYSNKNQTVASLWENKNIFFLFFSKQNKLACKQEREFQKTIEASVRFGKKTWDWSPGIHSLEFLNDNNSVKLFQESGFGMQCSTKSIDLH